MDERKHLLVVLSDQHSPRFIGGGGDGRIQTPSLDRLAAEGVTFDACYTNFPLCVPSRMSLLTSRYNHQLQIWGNSDALGSNVPTFAHGLGLAGYRTVLAGRMHFVGADQHHGFQERYVGDVSSGHLGVNRAEYRFRGFYGCRESLNDPGPGIAHDLVYDQAVACEACRVIRDHDESGDPRPLCLVVGFYSPHDPYRVYDRFYRAYAGDTDLPVDWHGESLHPVNAEHRQRATYAEVSEEQVRRARAAYRGKVAFVDELVGLIADTWRESRLGAESVTVYTSDHGEMAGEHGLWAKGCFYEGSARVPMIVSGRGVAGGRRCSDVVSLLDLGPTLLDLAGAEPLPGQQGRSLKPLLAGTVEDWNGIALSELVVLGAPSRMVRCGPWKLVAYDGYDDELFNLDDDPDELHNLASDADHAAVIAELHELLAADGWSPPKIRETIASRGPDHRYLARWTQAVQPKDPIQWGMPAPL